MISVDRLRELFHYSPDTGEFIRLVAIGPAKAGEVAGFKNSLGYVQISVDGTRQYAHRLAWLYVKGTHPSKLIDHVNGNKSDNRIDNLREASSSENLQNAKEPHRDSRSGLRGVAWDRCRGKWLSRVQVNKKSHHVGYFSTAAEAHNAYLVAKGKLHPFAPKDSVSE